MEHLKVFFFKFDIITWNISMSKYQTSCVLTLYQYFTSYCHTFVTILLELNDIIRV